MPSIADLEYAYLGSLGATGLSLADRRAQIYTPSEWDYFSSRSGLTPVTLYSLNDHKVAYYRTAVSAWVEQRRNLMKDPRATSGTFLGPGTGSSTAFVTDFPGRTNTAFRSTRTTADIAIRMFDLYVGADIPANGETVMFRSKTRVAAPVGMDVCIRPDSTTTAGRSNLGAFDQSPPGVLDYASIAPTFTGQTVHPTRAGIVPVLKGGYLAVGEWMDITEMLLEVTSVDRPYFDGDSTPSNPLLERYRWLGTPNASPSVYETRATPDATLSLTDAKYLFFSRALGL